MFTHSIFLLRSEDEFSNLRSSPKRPVTVEHAHIVTLLLFVVVIVLKTKSIGCVLLVWRVVTSRSPDMTGNIR
jgi:hypothetical protein